MRRALALLLAGVLALGAGWIRGYAQATAPARQEARELLYLPNGRYLKLVSLGFAPLLADAIYLWAIQYYADYQRADRFRYVRHVFGDVIAELDPHYLDPYWLGALILTVEAGDLEGGLALLELGFERNPDAWILPYLAGWEAARFGALERAIAYFERAAAVPGAPSFVRRLPAGMYRRAGHLEEALRRWQALLYDPQSDEMTRAIAERQVRDLIVRLDLDRLREALARFEREQRRRPVALEELVRLGYLERIPRDPDGRPYRYDPHSGTVGTEASRILGER